MRVAVVGAGLAGLTAAYFLKHKGHNVKVFEARPRVGGRVHTVYIKNFDGNYSSAELGGQSINDGGDSTHIKQLIRELNLKLNEYKTNSNVEFYHAGKYYNRDDFKSEISISKKELIIKFQSYKNKNISVGQVLDDLLDKNSCLKRVLTYRMHAYEGSHPSKLSIHHNLATLKSLLFGILDSNQFWLPANIVGGNALLAIRLANFLDISLSKILDEVYHDQGDIVLKFKDGSRYASDKLILAIPASTYKNIKFNGLIEGRQLNIFDQIQYGSNAKILSPIGLQDLQTDIVTTSKMCAWFDKELNIATYYVVGDDGNDKRLCEVYINQQYVFKEQYPGSRFHTTSPSIAKDEQFTLYNGAVLKSWVNDSYSLGSYSNYGMTLNWQLDEKIKYKNIILKKIFAPINDKIFFIGEHTSTINEIGTMEAAVESGKRIGRLF